MREWVAIPNTRGNLFWRGREDEVPRGRTRDLNEVRRAERFDEAAAAKWLWDRNVNPMIPSTVDEHWPLMYLMTSDDVDERIEVLNLFSSIALLSNQFSLQEIRKGAKSLHSGGNRLDWPPSGWQDMPHVKRFWPGLELQLKKILVGDLRS